MTTQYSIGNVNVHVTGEAVLYIISESHNTIFTIKYDNDNLLIVCYQAKGTLYALTCLLENMKTYIFLIFPLNEKVSPHVFD